MEALEGSCWFSVIDLRSGFWQVEIEEQDKCKKCIFNEKFRVLAEYPNVFRSHTNVPETFQQVMEPCMGDLYLITFSTWTMLFHFLWREPVVKIGGCIYRPQGCWPQIKTVKVPVLSEVHKVYRTCSFRKRCLNGSWEDTFCGGIAHPTSLLRRSSPSLGSWDFTIASSRIFAKIARPLHAFTQGQGSEKKGQEEPPRTSLQWNQEHQQAFEKVIKGVTTAPVLGFANYNITFELYTDPSGEGPGAVLYQTTNGQKRVIAYASVCLR